MSDDDGVAVELGEYIELAVSDEEEEPVWLTLWLRDALNVPLGVRETLGERVELLVRVGLGDRVWLEDCVALGVRC